MAPGVQARRILRIFDLSTWVYCDREPVVGLCVCLLFFVARVFETHSKVNGIRPQNGHWNASCDVYCTQALYSEIFNDYYLCIRILILGYMLQYMNRYPSSSLWHFLRELYGHLHTCWSIHCQRFVTVIDASKRPSGRPTLYKFCHLSWTPGSLTDDFIPDSDNVISRC